MIVGGFQIGGVDFSVMGRLIATLEAPAIAADVASVLLHDRRNGSVASADLIG